MRIIFILILLMLSACSERGLYEIGRQYQCNQDAQNHPQGDIRQAECQSGEGNYDAYKKAREESR
jgi:hypothetical protein